MCCDLPFFLLMHSKFLIHSTGFAGALMTLYHSDTWLPSNLLSACSLSFLRYSGAPHPSYLLVHRVQMTSLILCSSCPPKPLPILSPPLTYHTWNTSSQRLIVYSSSLACTALNKVVPGSLVKIPVYYYDHTNRLLGKCRKFFFQRLQLVKDEYVHPYKWYIHSHKCWSHIN